MNALHTINTYLLAQQPAPFPSPGQGGDVIDVQMTTPPSGDKFQILLGVGLWAATAFLIGLGMMAGVKFAQSFADGTAGRGEKMMVVGVAVGAIITSSAASYVTWFME